ncbi:MAG: hypothetical protein ACO3VR_14265 [Lutimaribacter sp.]
MAAVRHLGLFPWCVPVGQTAMYSRLSERSGIDYSNTPIQPTGGGSFWPISLSLNQLVLLWWRVKTLKHTNIDGTQRTMQVVPNANDEKDLMCFGDFPVAPEITGDDYLLFIDWEFTYFEANIQRFWVAIGLVFYFFDEDTNTEQVGQYSYGPQGGIPDAIFGGNIDFLGTPFPLGYPPQTNTSFAAGTVSVEEYWPYDPGDGLGPIYDSATGAQLRAFPS